MAGEVNSGGRGGKRGSEVNSGGRGGEGGN